MPTVETLPVTLDERSSSARGPGVVTRVVLGGSSVADIEGQR